MRFQYPLKVETIRKELNSLVAFLPQGCLEGCTANVFKIIWHPHSKPVSLKFEFPHEKDSNVLELGYLHGLTLKTIRHNLLRLPQAIMFILGNRAS